VNSRERQKAENALRRMFSVYRDKDDIPHIEFKTTSTKDTPARVVRMYEEFFSAEEPDFTTFSADVDTLVVVRDIEFVSVCEHHLLPFYGRAHVGYLPDGKIAGLSKFGRVVDFFAKRPQLQERMTDETAEYLMKKLKPRALCVYVEAKHTCMALRGTRKLNSTTVTHAIRGNEEKVRFEVKREFLQMLKGGLSNGGNSY